MKISLPDFGDIIGKFKGDGKSNSFLDTLKEKYLIYLVLIPFMLILNQTVE